MLQDKERSLSEREEKVTRYDVETATGIIIYYVSLRHSHSTIPFSYEFCQLGRRG